MILSVALATICLIQCSVYAQIEYTTPCIPQSTINLRAVVARLNDVFGLGMNISKIIEDYKAKHEDTYQQDEVLNRFSNTAPPNNQNSGFQYGMPNNNIPNQFAQGPHSNGFGYPNNMQQFPQNNVFSNGNVGGFQNGGFVPQNAIPNIVPNQFAPRPRNDGSLSNDGTGNMQISGGGPQISGTFNRFGQQNGGGFISQNSIPNNLPNQFAPRLKNDGSLSNDGTGNMHISGGGPQNTGPFNGFGQQNGGGFISQNAIPNNLPNQFAPRPKNDGSLSNDGTVNMQISGGGPQNSGPFNGFGQQNGGGFISQNAIPNNLPNQFASRPKNDGSLSNDGTRNMQISGGGPQNSGPFNGFGQQNGGNFISQNQMQFIPGEGAHNEKIGTFGSMPPELLAKNFGPLSQSSSNVQNGLPFPGGMDNGMGSPMSQNSFNNDQKESPNQFANAQPSLFNMFQQSITNQNQMGGNQNTLTDPNLAKAQPSLFKMFQQSMSNQQQMGDKQNYKYNDVCNFNEDPILHQETEQHQPQSDLKQQKAQPQQRQPVHNQFQQQLKDELKQQQEQTTKSQYEQNQEVDNFIKRMLGNDVFDYARKELKFRNETIGKDKYPATEESLFKAVTDDACFLTNDKFITPETTKECKYFHILKHPDEPIEKIKKKILWQNEWVKADENKLNAFFKDVKKDQEDKLRDEMYGRVKRGVIIDEGMDENEKTTRRTHIYEDIQLGLKDWIHFGQHGKSEEFFPNITTNGTQNTRSKREIAIDERKNYDEDEAIAKLAKLKSEESNNIITNFLDYSNQQNHLRKVLHQKFETEHDIRQQRYKRDIVSNRRKPVYDEGEALAKLLELKEEESDNIITNFMDYYHEQRPYSKKGNLRQQRYKRDVGFNERKRDYDEDEAIAKLANLHRDESNNIITNFMDYCNQENHPLRNAFKNLEMQHDIRQQRYKRNVAFRERNTGSDEDEAIAKLAKLKNHESDKIITNFMDYCNQQTHNSKKNFHNKLDDIRQHRYKRDLALNKRKYEYDEDEAIAKLAKLKNEESNNIINDFMDYFDEQNPHSKNNLHRKLDDIRKQRYERDVRFNSRKHYEPDKVEAHAYFSKMKTEENNKLITNFLDYFDQENHGFNKNGHHIKRRNRNLQETKSDKSQENAPKKLSRRKRQSKSNDDMHLLTKDLIKKAEKYSRMQYNVIFPEILKDFEIFREATFVKALRKAYRSNGWPAKEFKVPETPQDVLPQVFRHFKFISKTNLEEYYFIMMLRLPKLIKLYQRTLNIVDRGFKEPTNGQLQGYMNRETEIEKDFAEFSKILRSKIFNAYLDFEDRYNEESPKFFYLETMPPFNKDPTAPPEMEKFKDTGF